MDRALFAASDAGRVIRTRTGYDAFVPAGLPPTIGWDTRLARAIESTARAIGEADALYAGEMQQPLHDLLLAKEACSVARVEGQPTSLDELFSMKATGIAASRGAKLALNYTLAFHHVESRLEEMPLSLRLLREAHYLLSQGLEHSGSYPGEFRRSQNWLGPEGCGLAGATLVPPPVEEMKLSLDNWENYLHATDSLPATARMSALHCQFLMIRPFLEYNDAVLLVMLPFVLHQMRLSATPIPAIGGFVGQRLQEYQQRMLDVCQRGAWEEWLAFYLYGIAAAFRHSTEAMRRLHDLQLRYAGLLTSADDLTREAMTAVWQQPVLTIEAASRLLHSSREGTAQTLSSLADVGVLQLRGQSEAAEYAAVDIIAALEQGPAAFDGAYAPFF